MLHCQYLLNQCIYWTITIDASNWDASYWTAILAMRLTGMRLSGWEPCKLRKWDSSSHYSTCSLCLYSNYNIVSVSVYLLAPSTKNAFGHKHTYKYTQVW